MKLEYMDLKTAVYISWLLHIFTPGQHPPGFPTVWGMIDPSPAPSYLLTGRGVGWNVYRDVARCMIRQSKIV